MGDRKWNRWPHTRRQSQANEALFESSTSGQAAESPKPRKRGRKPKKQPKEQKVAGQQEALDDDDLPKDPRRRQRNRIAANKRRLRKRDEALVLASREEAMEDQNRYLMMCFDSLKVEIYQLKTELLRHTECNCVLIQNYIANEAQKCVERGAACSTAFDIYGNSLSLCDGSPSGAITAEELNMYSLNGGCFPSTPRTSSQQGSSTSEITGVMFDMMGLGPFQTATIPPDSMALTHPVLPLSFTEYGPGLSVYEGPRELQAAAAVVTGDIHMGMQPNLARDFIYQISISRQTTSSHNRCNWLSMAVLSKLLGFPSLTLAAVVESVLAIKLFPNYYSTQSHLAAVATILLVNYAFGIVFWVLLYPVLFSPLRRIPGPKASEISFLFFKRNRAYLSPAYRALIVKDKPVGDLILELAKQYPEEDLITLNSFRDQICIMNPQLLADLLVYNCYNFAKPKRISSFLRHILGDGLIIVEGDQHKFLRRNTMPAFHLRHIKELYPMMWAKGETLAKALNQDMAASRSSVVELNGWASKVTLDIIGIAGLGHKFDAVEKRKDPLADIYEQLLEPDREKLIFAMISLALVYQSFV
ncbi:hypothetical protein HZS61_008972 [Fusarium oxysporum f. sp. conglutinans]|uniref:BZIP domain-containing protein n=1 Tax=Fusarium oxysporum f. sp. conglutinans TaxID=100902 RepID=A0A8H6H3T0_FUSOX|nr:hypothetical protein HZS61_008972 [Fusarium oxysporum f. sp. conglutinans]